MQFVPIATDDRRLLATGDVETWRRNCCDIGASEVVAVEERLHLILDGKLNEIEDRRPVRSQTTAFPDGFRDEEELVLTRIQSGFGTHFLVTAEGVLLAKGATSSGQCGVVQAEYVKEWRRVDLVNPQTPCKHGTRPSATNKITVSDVVCSQKQVCVLDSSSRIWTYGNGNLHKDKNGAIICKLLNLMPNRRVIQFAAGRGHFLALVEHSPPSTIVELPEGEENVFDGRMLKSCADCLEDERMRLSNLMIEADKAAETSKIHLIPVSASTPIAPKKSASSSSILLSNVVQGSADSWSLPGLRKGRRSRESCGDIEMTTISHEFVGEPTEFSFVNLENAILSDSDESSFMESKSSTADIPEAVKMSVATSGEAPLIEIWSWGANECGQLGHGDFIARREPFPVNKLIGVQGVKVVAGEEHSAVLTGTGEVYVWGSNCRGQLKQTEQTHVAQPFLFKVGSQSSVLDVAAGGQSTAVIVSGIDSTPVVYYCGSHSKQMPDGDYQVPLTLRIAVFEKIGWPLAVSLLDGGRQLFLGFHPRNVDDETDVSMVFNTVFGDLKFARMIVQLTKVAQQLHERSQHYQKSEDACKLLNDLTVSLSVFSASVARIANSSLYHLSRCGDVNLRNLLGARENDAFYSSIQKLHKAYVGCIAYGCFADIRIEPELEAAVERLCLEYEAESAKQHRRLGKLFQMAFMCVSQIKQMREQLAVGDAVKEDKSNQDQWAGRWRALEHQIETETAAAVDTFRFWNRTTISALRKSGRLLLWLADNQASGGLVKDISNLTWRSFLGRGWTTLAVFSDTVAVVQKNDYQTFDFPLVWLKSIQSDDKAIVKVLTPEAHFDIEFFDACGKTAFIQACSFWRSGTSTAAPPVRRCGPFRYSNTHATYRNCSYLGAWQLGKPHGLGVIVYPDGKTYKGHFQEGVIQGFGEMSVPNEPQSASIMNSVFFVESSPAISPAGQKCDVCVGKWVNGQMNGLVAIKYGDGSSYEGYCKNGQRHGHGVFRSSIPFIGPTIYVGSWREGVKHGYGVHSTNRERYLGMWQDDLKHGLGALVTIDGIFHEGIFEKDKMTKGRLVIEGDSPMDYEGDFENIGIPSGKGALQVTPFLRIEGSVSGNLLNGEVKISTGTLLRTPEDKRLKGRSMEDDGPHESSIGKWTVLPDDKWVDIFDQFEFEYFGINGDKVDEMEAKTLWSNLVGSLAKIKAFKNLKLDDEMERIPDFEAEWSNSYYAMAREFWVLATAAKGVHPLHRLLKGITEVFTCSYNNIGTHPALYDQVVLEFRSLIRRTFRIVRRLFVNLPPIDDMYEGVPQRADVIHADASDASDSPPSDSAMTSSNEGVEKTPSEKTLVHQQSTIEQQENDESLSVPTPACDFVLNSLFAECYAVLYTICSMSCAEMDKKYWERVLYLNAHTDVKLLTYLDVDRDLWPIDIEDASHLDAPMIRATARKKFYKSAIHTMQRLSCEYNPTAKLAILAETFSEITTCVSRFALAGSEHVWSSDDLLPAFMYVVVRAQIQHLGAEIRLTEDFSPHLRGAGQIELMFTMLKASFVHICNEKSLP